MSCMPMHRWAETPGDCCAGRATSRLAGLRKSSQAAPGGGFLRGREADKRRKHAGIVSQGELRHAGIVSQGELRHAGIVSQGELSISQRDFDLSSDFSSTQNSPIYVFYFSAILVKLMQWSKLSFCMVCILLTVQRRGFSNHQQRSTGIRRRLLTAKNCFHCFHSLWLSDPFALVVGWIN